MCKMFYLFWYQKIRKYNISLKKKYKKKVLYCKMSEFYRIYVAILNQWSARDNLNYGLNNTKINFLHLLSICLNQSKHSSFIDLSSAFQAQLAFLDITDFNKTSNFFFFHFNDHAKAKIKIQLKNKNKI